MMAGVESVIGGFSRFLIKEKLRNLDAKYTKKWLIREDAEDLLALKYEEISLDEHYARLYGPRILVHQNKVNEILRPDVISDADDSSHNNTEVLRPKSVRSQTSKASQSSAHIDRKQLQQAFSSNPYERFKHKNYREDSEEHIIEQIQKQRAARTKAIWSAALASVTSANNGNKQQEQTPITPGSNNEEEHSSPTSSGFKASSKNLADVADQLLQSKKQPPTIVRGQSHHGDGYRLRQVYREAFLQHKKTDQGQDNDNNTDIENEAQMKTENKSHQKDTYERHR